ncbi:AI-2E family transporter [Methylocapsa polymorpha]|uniref:AI-2E family transporter n=1 Tax=Methylocapsa polymorpha TaxID=3080828 RepID=A0ABZ0HV54_9HYPH|nr:AI-2E family transporter [Methylocapsa sp. RX1]
MSADVSDHETAQTPALWALKSRTQASVLLGATGVGIYICYRLALPFLPALTWALALAILFASSHRAIESRLKWPNLAATISVVVAALIVVAPAIFVAERLVNEAAKGASVIQAQIEAGAWRRAIEAHPRLAPVDEWLQQQINLPAIFGNAASWLTNAGATFVRGSVVQLAGVLLTFYFLFYFLRDRRLAVKSLRRLSPLSPVEMDRLFVQVVDTIYATIYGTVVVAGVQGALGGLMFWWLGLPTPLLWGLVMGLLAVVPVLGAFIVWIPATIFLALDGSWTKAVILGLWGGAVVSTIDNILYPILVGNRLKLHSVPAFISLIGGLSLFGAVGLILGPIAVTITMTLLDAWRTRFAETKE